MPSTAPLPASPSTAAAPLSPVIGALAALVTIAIWVMFIVIGRASASASLLPIDIMFLRFVGAGFAMAGWMWVRRWRNPPAATGYGWLGLSPLSTRLTVKTGLAAGVGYSALAYSAFVFAPAAHASIFLPGSLPLWTALLSVLLLGEALPRRRLLGLGVLLVGALVGGIGEWQLTVGSDQAWIGDLLFMAAAFSWSIYALMLRRHALDAVEATAAVALFCLLTFVPLYGLLAAPGVVPSRLGSAPLTEIVLQAFFQGIFSVVISGISVAVMVRHYGAVRPPMLTATVPGLSALAATAVLGEPLHGHLILGLALVTLGILIGATRSPRTGDLA